MNKIIGRLEARGMKINREYEYVDTPKGREKRDKDGIETICAPLTPEDWCRMCMRDGDNYIGGCCGNTGVVQDILNSIFRDSGWIDWRMAEELCHAAANHEGHELLYEKSEKKLLAAEEKWDELYPIDKLFLAVAAVKAKMRVHAPHKEGVDLENEGDIVSMLHKGVRYLDFKDLFNDKDDGPAKKGQKHGNTALCLARTVPAAKAFLGKVATMKELPFDGFALVDEKGKLGENMLGVTIYTAREQAEETLGLWAKDDTERKKGEDTVADKYKVRPVRVTVEKGLEIL